MKLMILAASGAVPIIINVLLVILVALSLLLCLVILMQRPKQEGLGAAFGGGMTDQAFGARTTDVLQKGTVWLGTLFFVITLTLSLLVASQSETKEVESTLAEIEASQEAEKVEAEQAPAEEVAPVEEATPAEAAEAPKLAEEAVKQASEELTQSAPAAEEAAKEQVEAVQEQVTETAAAVEEKVEEAAAEVPAAPKAEDVVPAVPTEKPAQ
ncbi:preprotein translocase subunit SecG [Rubritalea marina]|uniref:preprotein translocase subunit SecG n=1 Tax=Rubritalea marina TaxID=361055 RepID=UPI001F0B411F|nr:preprotein translocase subunit SecG [Rubritalea marina]